MTTAAIPTSTQPETDEPLLELHNGDRMTQAEFHLVHEAMPEHIRAELIGGIVYMSSPLQLRHEPRPVR